MVLNDNDNGIIAYVVVTIFKATPRFIDRKYIGLIPEEPVRYYSALSETKQPDVKPCSIFIVIVPIGLLLPKLCQHLDVDDSR